MKDSFLGFFALSITFRSDCKSQPVPSLGVFSSPFPYLLNFGTLTASTYMLSQSLFLSPNQSKKCTKIDNKNILEQQKQYL